MEWKTRQLLTRSLNVQSNYLGALSTLQICCIHYYPTLALSYGGVKNYTEQFSFLIAFPLTPLKKRKTFHQKICK